MCRKLALAATTAAALMSGAPAMAALPWAQGPKPAAPAPVAPKASAPTSAHVKASSEERAQAERLDPLARAAFWAGQVNADPRDAEAGVKLSASLRALGRIDEASEAAQRVIVVQPDYVDGLLEVARNFIAANQGFYAIEPARRAKAAAPRDWRPLALLGVALEQAQRPDEALSAHREALALSPNNPALLSNLGMFYASQGDTAQAETLLRQAAADPAAPPQVRQNLALILGLKGDMASAERLARQDLPPETVANNLAYLRAATGRSPTDRSWDAVRSAQSSGRN